MAVKRQGSCFHFDQVYYCYITPATLPIYNMGLLNGSPSAASFFWWMTCQPQSISSAGAGAAARAKRIPSSRWIQHQG